MAGWPGGLRFSGCSLGAEGVWTPPGEGEAPGEARRNAGSTAETGGWRGCPCPSLGQEGRLQRCCWGRTGGPRPSRVRGSWNRTWKQPFPLAPAETEAWRWVPEAVQSLGGLQGRRLRWSPVAGYPWAWCWEGASWSEFNSNRRTGRAGGPPPQAPSSSGFAPLPLIPLGSLVLLPLGRVVPSPGPPTPLSAPGLEFS